MLKPDWWMGTRGVFLVLQEEQGQSPKATSQEWTLTIVTSQPLAFIYSPFYMLLSLETPCPFLYILTFLLLRNCVASSEFWVSLIKEFKIGFRRKLKDKFVKEKAGQRSCETQRLPGGGRWMDGRRSHTCWVEHKSLGDCVGRGITEHECGCPECQIQTGLGLCLVFEEEREGERWQSYAFGQA